MPAGSPADRAACCSGVSFGIRNAAMTWSKALASSSTRARNSPRSWSASVATWFICSARSANFLLAAVVRATIAARPAARAPDSAEAAPAARRRRTRGQHLTELRQRHLLEAHHATPRPLRISDCGLRNVSAQIVDPGMRSTQYLSQIADWLLAFSSLRFPPCLGSLDGRHGNRQEFVRLSHQWFHHVHLRYSAFDKQLHPVRGFIQFLFNKAHLCNEVTGGSGTAGSSVVSTHGRAGTQ